jgi:nucleoside-diphosphate-sugar epimerase
MKIVVIGGTGLIGSKTVAILRQGGHEVVAASPKSGINTITGEWLKEAMAGAQVVIDLAGPRVPAALPRCPSTIRGAPARY